MSTSYAETTYGLLMVSHPWTYSELTELMELLDRKQMELAKEESMWTPEEVIIDEGNYSIIEKENIEAIIDLPY